MLLYADADTQRQLWRQLSLLPSRIETSSNKSRHSHDIKVCLIHSDEGDEQPKRKLHKLGADVPFQDVRPPEGALSATLESVYFTLRIGRLVRRKRPRLNQRARNVDTPDRTADEVDAASDIFDAVGDELLDSYVDNSSEYVLAAPHDLLSKLPEPLLSPGDADNGQDDAGMLLDMDEQDMIVKPRPSSQTPSLLKRASSGTDPEVGAEDCSADAILPLIDAAIRLAISKTPRWLDKDIVVKDRDSIQPLAEIAPTLWSPGYLPAVARRVVFLPTICHALTICSKHAKTASLKTKGAMLASQSLFRAYDRRVTNSGPLDVGGASLASSDDFSVRLWQILQNGLYDSGAARRLTSLSVTSEGTDEASEFEDVLLHSNQERCECVEHTSSVEDEDLLLDADLEEDKTIDEDLFGYDYDDSGYASIDDPKESDDSDDILDLELADHCGIRSSRVYYDIHPAPPPVLLSKDSDVLSTASNDSDGVEDLLSICGSVETISLDGDGCTGKDQPCSGMRDLDNRQ